MLSPEILQAVLDALPTPVFVKDRQGLYLGCNRAFSETLGKTPEEMAGTSVFDLWPGDLAQVYFDADEALMARGGEQRYEAQIVLPSGERRDVLFYKAVLKDAGGEVTGLVGTLLDITERKALERQLTELAERDSLTGLLNRRAIFQLLEGVFGDRRALNEPLSLLMCDVDHFKAINDQYGHLGGDEVLRATAKVLRAQLRDADLIARIGGEEFLVMLQNTTPEEALCVAERLRRAVEESRISLKIGSCA